LAGGALGGVARKLGSNGSYDGGFGRERDYARFRKGEGERRGKDGMFYLRVELEILVVMAKAHLPTLL
jgi:hypothetical protein